MIAGVPYWRLSSFYFFYFALLGTWLPYWALYLKDLGFSSTQIGTLSAVVMVTKVVAPNIWGWLADHYHCRTRIIRWGAFLATIAFAGVYLGSHFWWLAAVVAAYSFFWNAVLSQFDVLTLSHLQGRHGRYSLIRVWGSVGFIVAVLGVGAWLDRHPIIHLLYMISLLLTGIWLASMLVAERPRDSGSHERPPQGSLRAILLQPAVIAFFAMTFLLQFSHGPYYTFFSIYLEGFSYSKSMIGVLWSLGVVAEVLIFLVMHRLLARFSLREILLWSLSLTALRWLMIGFVAQSTLLLVVAQCMHAASFGSSHAAAVEVIRRWFPRHHGQGMALYSGLSFGAGGATGALFSGVAWDWSPVWCFVIAALAGGLGWLVTWLYFDNPEGESDEGLGSLSQQS